MRVLVFGDSITQGFWDTEGGWANRLRKYFDEQQVRDLHGNNEPTIFNLGISGNTSEDLLARIESETMARKHRDELLTILIQIGINDSMLEGGTEERVSIGKYAENLAAIVAKIKPFNSKLAFVGLPVCDESKTTPVFWRNIHYTNTRIKAYEDAMRQVAAEQQLPFVPLFDIFQMKQAKRELLSDGLHPNDAGHELMADLIRPELDKLLDS